MQWGYWERKFQFYCNFLLLFNYFLPTQTCILVLISLVLLLWQLAEKYGNVFSLKMGSTWTVVLTGFNALQEGLVTKGDILTGRPDFPIHFDIFPSRGLYNGKGLHPEDYLLPSPRLQQYIDGFYSWCKKNRQTYTIHTSRNAEYSNENRIVHPIGGCRYITVHRDSQCCFHWIQKYTTKWKHLYFMYSKISMDTGLMKLRFVKFKTKSMKNVCHQTVLSKFHFSHQVLFLLMVRTGNSKGNLPFSLSDTLELERNPWNLPYWMNLFIFPKKLLNIKVKNQPHSCLLKCWAAGIWSPKQTVQASHSSNEHISIGCVWPVINCAGKPFNPHLILNNAVSNIISVLVFGHRFEYNDKKFQRMLKLFDQAGLIDGSIWAQVLHFKAMSERFTIPYHFVLFSIHWSFNVTGYNSWVMLLDMLMLGVLFTVFSLAQLYNSFPALMRRLPGPHHTLQKFLGELVDMVRTEVIKHRKDWDPSEPRDFIDCYLNELQKVSGQTTSWL